MVTPLILYSTNSLLAFRISEKFYKGEHFVYCTPNFRLMTRVFSSSVVPPSSCPYVIYRNFSEEIENIDPNGLRILANKAGLKHGATTKLKPELYQNEKKMRFLK